MRDQSFRSSKWTFYIILPAILAAILVLLILSLAAAQVSGGVSRITTASDNNRDSSRPSLSANGMIVAFYSDSDFLGQGILDEQREIWLYNMATMTYTRVTTASDSNRSSSNPHLSADGATVAFQSDSDFLGQDIPDEQLEIWLYDTATMTYTRVTAASDSNRSSYWPALNADGTIVAFQSDSDFLGQGIPDDQGEVWLYNTATMTYTRVTTASDSNRSSSGARLSADGTLVGFQSDSDLLNQGIPDEQTEVWLYDTTTMTYTRVTTASDINRDSYIGGMSADGTLIAFFSDSDLLGQGIPDGQFEIWLYSTVTMTYTRVTTASDGNRDSYSYGGGVSADGMHLVFSSDSDFLGQGVPDEQYEIWLYDMTTMTYTRITSASDGLRDSSTPALSADGTVVAFQSDSDLLNEGRPDDVNEIWIWGEFDHVVYLPLVVRQYQ